MYFVIHLNKVKNVNRNELSYCSINCNTKIENGKLNCNCGDDVQIFEWRWIKDDSVNFQLDTNDLEVTFHPVYSSGTAVVRGNKPLQKNMHHYWEIKMISNLYGTDVMVGVGTEKTMNCKFRFCSMLGLDDQSWGYSYHGEIQHNKLTRKYGKHFGLGCLVGIHLDMYTGRLEYYLNRKSLGIAFDGLKSKELYPMACSTAAHSSMKLNCAVSQEQTLQMLCLKCVQQHPSLHHKYRTIPGLYRYYDKKYFWMVPKEEKIRSKEEEDDDLHLMSIKNSSCTIRKKRFSDYIWSKPSKKITRNTTNTSRPQNIGHTVSRPSSSSDTDAQGQDRQDEDACKLLYECLTDSDNENVQDLDSGDEFCDKVNVMVPIQDDEDSLS